MTHDIGALRHRQHVGHKKPCRKSSPTTVWTTIRAHGRRHVRGTRMLAAPACARRVRRSRTIT
ncbi:hypothetical protein, partial [Polyangium sp. 15x6]|uniref:hypothetical protein n=1 Tax=Polyangium sp. 15x6 TaxID=3042687 RepID=UPI00249A8FAD